MPRPLRILWVVSELERRWTGGIGRVVAGALAALAEQGHDVHLAGSKPAWESPGIEGVSLHVWPPRRRKVEQLGPLRRLHRERGFDVVHFHSALPHGSVILPFLWLAGKRRPLVVATPYTGARSSYPKRLSRLALRHVDAVVTNSAWGAEQVKRASGRNAVHVIPAGVAVPPPADETLRRPTVLVLARLVESKGVDVLLEAFGRVAATRPDWKLRIAGSGREEGTLRERAKSLAAADRIEFLGSVDGEEKAKALAAASIGVVPSRFDNYPGSFLELQAHGVPCIASDVGGLPEIAAAGEAALLVPPDDPAALVAALGDLMDRPERRAALGRAGRSTAEGRSFARVAEQHAAFYREQLDLRE